ncbi:MAG: ribosome small subunit-dependent GTPase A [Candidatus Melainabacteria bacterium]|nr:ribosome small subunit-dependent GTPase A [Candidatus Melainabacteria bacterium]MBI3307848.1 ribosome small subunit-dependent GTPase A [Candidatus Melainabacteria bacterium]
MNLKGKLIKILANFYYVQDINGITWECFARARLLKEGKLVLVGDEVEFETSTSSKPQGVIVDVCNRKNKISKPNIANIDQVLVVFSTVEPDFDFYSLDRYLSFIKYELPEEEIIICINKIDLKQKDINDAYEKAGFKIFYVSALTKEGLNSLSSKLKNKTTVLTGPSGVGKSSLIKAFAPEINIEIGSLSAIQQGTHKTRNIQLIPVNIENTQGFLADTPGFTQITFEGLNQSKILATFPDLNNIGCSFDDCLHSGEDGCVLNNPEKQPAIAKSRIESYRLILNESKSKVIYGSKKESSAKIQSSKTRNKSKVIPKIDKETREKSRKRTKQELRKIDFNNIDQD